MQISAVTQHGVRELVQRMWEVVRKLKQADSVSEEVEVETVVLRPRASRAPVEDFRIVQEDDVYVVEGEGLMRLMRRLDLENEEAIIYLQNLFGKIGLYEALADLNVPEGATVRVGELEFEYME